MPPLSKEESWVAGWQFAMEGDAPRGLAWIIRHQTGIVVGYYEPDKFHRAFIYVANDDGWHHGR
jgi:hypothetical protein